MGDVMVSPATPAEAGPVFQLVSELLAELGEEGEETGALDEGPLLHAWSRNEAAHFVFLAREGSSAVGVATIAEAFAIYAGGHYGIINEMYVRPGYRSRRVGALLLDAAKHLARQKGWRRLDVTAPESPRWVRTRQFYEREGFCFTGPKLKYLLGGDGGEVIREVAP